MIPESIYPWQTTQWQQLWRTHSDRKLPHALLFVGEPGLGKRQFALALANAVLCQQPSTSGQWCGQCRPCYLLQAGSHPDLMIVAPEESGQTIGIDQIRDVVTVVNETAQQGGYRIIVIDPATAMNMNAANALLKTLEEPSPRVLFILISHQSVRLPATIVSRCQKITFAIPETRVALEWLQASGAVAVDSLPLLLRLAHGAPLQAKALTENGSMSIRRDLYQGLYALSQAKSDPLRLAAALQDHDVRVVLTALLSALADLLRLQVTQDLSVIVNVDYKSILGELSQRFTSASLSNYIEMVQQRYATVMSSLNLNRQLLLEELFIKWTHYVSR